MTAANWKQKLGDDIPENLGKQIDAFETQMNLRLSGKLEDKIFAEMRLRKGIYGQRYDNGQRHDGVQSQHIPWKEDFKGPDTYWDAPGMMRIKIPMGRLTSEQLDCMAELAEEYSDAILHVTTRQDIQLHFVHIEDCPALMRRLAAVGVTTQEACGNSVRNTTACQFSGVCNDEAFDVTPYSHALTYYLLGHKDVQGFGRKFKIAFSGCGQHACGLAYFHDLGAIAVSRDNAGQTERGFKLLVGGGLGAVPRQAKVLYEFLEVGELLPVSQAVCRVFARLGEKQNRSRARIKFLVDNLGIEEFTKLVEAERAIIPVDERWTTMLDDLTHTDDQPLKPPAELPDGDYGADFEAWRRTNVRPQRQAGYGTATVRLPLGDMTSHQTRSLAEICRQLTGDTVRLTVEQNLVVRWIANADLPQFYAALTELGLNQAGAGTISDITACPGTDTCKLGIAASRGLAAELEERLLAKQDSLSLDIQGLRIKTSGCHNSCGQHHVADMGFLGVSRNISGRRVSHFRVVVGGEWTNNGGSYGLALQAYPSKRIPEVVDFLVAYYQEERTEGEMFKDFAKRVGRREIMRRLEPFREVPPYEVDPSFYTDWGDSREYTIGDLGVGECAGEVVSAIDFGLATAERIHFEAQEQLDAGDTADGAQTSWLAMLQAAKTLVGLQNIDITDDPDQIVSEFRTRYHDSGLFRDKYAGDKFANYLFANHAKPPERYDWAASRQLIEETQHFLEATRACYDRMQEMAASLDA